MENCAAFLESMNEAMEKEIAENAEGAALKERVWKINLMNESSTWATTPASRSGGRKPPASSPRSTRPWRISPRSMPYSPS
jgi:hypothetical protein